MLAVFEQHGKELFDPPSLAQRLNLAPLLGGQLLSFQQDHLSACFQKKKMVS
jgi:hypothetical protein